MSELVERYVHEVGRYLAPKERAEIEAELRSQIQDQLDDRYEGSASQADVVSVLAELGDPRQMANSYGSKQYLVGPDLYPIMMMVLRYGWLLVPVIVIFLNVFGMLISPQQDTWLGLVLETIISAGQAIFIFSGVVVLIFAVIQHSGMELETQKEGFNPLNLPKVDDPTSVDHLESTFGIAIGMVAVLVLLYFLSVGGLTLRFNLSDPGEVIPVPGLWLLLLIMTIGSILILQVVVLRRNRWSAGLWLIEIVLEVFGAICLYFVLYKPIFARIISASPTLSNGSFLDKAPEIIVVINAVITLVGRWGKQIKLWSYTNSSPLPAAIKADR